MAPKLRLSLCVVGAVVGACHAPEAQPQAAPADDDPPIHLHPHPEIPPDDLTAEPDLADALPPRESASGKLLEGCHDKAEPPPAPPDPPRIYSGPPVTNYIPPLVIMKPIRAIAGCMRLCYEQGLATHPGLAGRVAIKFVVDLDGWVRKAEVHSNELGDSGVAECVAHEFVGLLYPSPEGGRITVVYPVTFEPADAG